ncbi:hypothetical protein scyTo_0020189, partial [Scyliorhinus torazame]|nr:hypothetical protein [Scyliorhinus torazame]
SFPALGNWLTVQYKKLFSRLFVPFHCGRLPFGVEVIPAILSCPDF